VLPIKRLKFRDLIIQNAKLARRVGCSKGLSPGEAVSADAVALLQTASTQVPIRMHNNFVYMSMI
jgi:hypothetical protein